jgi:imidazole glycerol-phosphate synthase subunit HisH
MIAIVKYGMGNVASVQKALKKLGCLSVITDNHNEIRKSDIIILPGVGSFTVAMRNLHKSGLAELLTEEVVKKKKPFIGICLGMQLLATFGTEPSKIKGLGWIDGEVIKIRPHRELRIPHLGWDNVQTTDSKMGFYREFNGLDFYFIHSYYFVPKNQKDVVLKVKYGDFLTAGLQKNNIYAFQFHPEKSQDAGMKLLKKVIDQYAQM